MNYIHHTYIHAYIPIVVVSSVSTLIRCQVTTSCFCRYQIFLSPSLLNIHIVQMVLVRHQESLESVSSYSYTVVFLKFIFVFIYLSIYSFIHSFIYLSIQLFIDSFICFSIHVSIHSSIHLFYSLIHLSIHLFVN